MKKMSLFFAAVAATVLVSCGGGGGSTSSYRAPVTLDDLDDYFTVKSYKLETNVAEKGLEHFEDAKGTLVLVLKRNKEEMKLKPSDIDYAFLEGTTSATDYKVFEADVDAVARKLVKLEPGVEETVEIPIKIFNPSNCWGSDEKKLEVRQAHYDALTGVKGALEEISFYIELKNEEEDDD